MKWIILALGIAANASASVLIKVAMTPPRKLPSVENLLETLYNWPLWLGLGLYGGAFILYAVALAQLPLNIAHPVLTSGTVAVVAIFSILIFHEAFHWTMAAGIFLIISGVILITIRVQ